LDTGQRHGEPNRSVQARIVLIDSRSDIHTARTSNTHALAA
jgi:hypothetical protein